MENLHQYERHPYGTVQIHWIKFWQPFEKIIVPESGNNHYYVPLREGITSAEYELNLARFPGLSEVLNSTSYTSVATSCSFALKNPYFKYTFIRFLLFILMIVYFLQFITSCIAGNIFNIIYNLLFLILSPFLMRLGGKQYLERMRKYEKVLLKCCHGLSNTVLAGSGLVVEPGYRCLWLDFHQGGYAPPPAPAAIQNPVYYFPGMQVSNV